MSINTTNPINKQQLYFYRTAWVGSLVIAWKYLQPESIIEKVAAVAVGTAVPLITLIGCELAKPKLKNFLDKNRCHLTIPAIKICRIKNKTEYDEAFQRIQQLGAYNTYKKTEGLQTDVEAKAFLFRGSFGTCKAQTLELWDKVLVDPNISSFDLLTQMKQNGIVGIIYRQMASKLNEHIHRPLMFREEQDAKRFLTLVIYDSQYNEEVRSADLELAPILIHKKVNQGARFSAIEEREIWIDALNKVTANDELIGDIQLERENTMFHSIFVQSSHGKHRFYDINHGMYEYSDRGSLIEGLKAHILYREGKDVGIVFNNSLIT